MSSIIHSILEIKSSNHDHLWVVGMSDRDNLVSVSQLRLGTHNLLHNLTHTPHTPRYTNALFISRNGGR